MVILSAALRGIPEETLEAARIDGANDVQIFFNIMVPQIFPNYSSGVDHDHDLGVESVRYCVGHDQRPVGHASAGQFDVRLDGAWRRLWALFHYCAGDHDRRIAHHDLEYSPSQ